MNSSQQKDLYSDQIRFDNSYAKLPPQFYARHNPVPVAAPEAIIFNDTLAQELGWDLPFHSKQVARIFSGNYVPEGAEPLAMVYAGHQFGGFVPRLGDGRALLLGEVIDRQGQRRDIHFKGSGKTPYARGADGRSPLGPAVREYIVSEAMHALGIPTTRSLAVVATGEHVIREQELPGAVLTRIARSHIRIGTFEYFYARGDHGSLRILADYTIDRLYPELKQADNSYLALLEAVIARQARLVAQWMSVGFIHGVMNTDNTTISGETIDYGPCAFMEEYDPQALFSSIDSFGRYAYGHQGSIMQWNLTRLAETFLFLIDDDEKKAIPKAETALVNFAALFEEAWSEEMRRKLGLRNEEEMDVALIGRLLRLMHSAQADFTLAFRELSLAADKNPPDAFVLGDGAEAKNWLQDWQARLGRQTGTIKDHTDFMLAANPHYIPRNHLVERAISRLVEQKDKSEMMALLKAVQNPFTERKGLEEYALPANPEERVCQTFCGT